MKRGKRWQAQVDDTYERAIALGEELQARQARGEDIGDGIREWRHLWAKYNELHGAGKSHAVED